MPDINDIKGNISNLTKKLWQYYNSIDSDDFEMWNICNNDLNNLRIAAGMERV